MIIVVLVVLGLCAGSFVNALVWRIHEQSKRTKKAKNKDVSIVHGRSMCPSCKHTLSAQDLVPVFSWLMLRGKCRYCKKSISIQYPLVELSTAILFVASYIWWPQPFDFAQTVIFSLWLVILTALVALSLYDLKWYILPDRITRPLAGVAALMAGVTIFTSDNIFAELISTIFAVIIGGGLFYVLFQVSKGKWIGGGDVKLGFILGLIVGSPQKSLLFIFIAALLGSLISLPMLASHKLNRSSVIPFGPLLILGAIITVLFGTEFLDWYQHAFIL